MDSNWCIYLITGNHPAELPQVNGQVQFTAEISNRLSRWLAKMTQPYQDKRFDSARIAQTALTSPDGSYGDFINLKPTNSKIQLYRDRTQLEIIWQDVNHEESASAISGCLIWIMMFFTFILFGYHSFLGIFGMVALSIFCIIVRNYPSNKINYGLKIDDRSIGKFMSKSSHHQRQVLGCHDRSQISLLIYNPGYVFDKYLDDNGIIQHTGRVTIAPKLCLYGSSFEYTFSNPFSQAELWWLGRELSDFLDLELQIIYSTPQVPPVVTLDSMDIS